MITRGKISHYSMSQPSEITVNGETFTVFRKADKILVQAMLLRGFEIIVESDDKTRKIISLRPGENMKGKL